MKTLARVSLVTLLLGGCGGGTTPTPDGVATVRFTYLASTTTRTDVPNNLIACVRFSAPTHAHIGWRNFELVNMIAAGPDRWELTQTDVPVNQRVVILMSDPNACFVEPDGFALENVFANNVRLTTIVREVAGPGFAFRVAADGTVTP
jgi:hypothetical protein